MKHLLIYAAMALVLAAILSLAACSNDDSSPVTPVVIENQVKSGSWQITSFVDSGNDETAHFNGYTFTFGPNGTITATNGNQSHTGSYSILDGNSNDDSLQDLEFNIAFMDNDFEDLSEDWDIISQSSAKIELQHISGGNGGTDRLVFEKI